MDGLGWSKQDTIALGEFLFVGQCIGKSRKSFDDAFGLEVVAQEVLVQLGPFSSGVKGEFWLAAVFTLNLPMEASSFEN